MAAPKKMSFQVNPAPLNPKPLPAWDLFETAAGALNFAALERDALAFPATAAGDPERLCSADTKKGPVKVPQRSFKSSSSEDVPQPRLGLVDPKT